MKKQYERNSDTFQEIQLRLKESLILFEFQWCILFIETNIHNIPVDQTKGNSPQEIHPQQDPHSNDYEGINTRI